MARILSRFRRPLGGIYNLWRLVDSRFFDHDHRYAEREQLICDIDKTYLETDFDSLLKIAKIAFEDAHDKITVPGASEVLLAARWGNMAEGELESGRFPRPLHFVSSSPPQLRTVLEEKFALDGLDWSSDTFKNQAYNIRKGRFDLLRQQIAYKTAAILNLISKQEGDVSYYMLGDNAEADAQIYLGVKLFIERRLSPRGYLQYLQLVGVEEDVAHDLLDRFTVPPRGMVRGILIRRVKNLPYFERSAITRPIVEFENFVEVALLFALLGLFDASVLEDVLRRLHNRYALTRESIAAAIEGARPLAGTTVTEQDFARLAARWGRVEDGRSLRLPHENELGHMSEDEMLHRCKLWISHWHHAPGQTSY